MSAKAPHLFVMYTLQPGFLFRGKHAELKIKSSSLGTRDNGILSGDDLPLPIAL